MPGFIQVSVLDFKELPSSSNFVKVSLGKVEHEAGEKGTISFPLMNLRDNLIITILDSHGNQVSQTGVRTISIIEKGTWDDLFPIEGGGLVHMKLQFILSDEERNRIHAMREYAMKKKQDEILNGRLRNAESAKSLASSLNRHEVSDILRITSSQDLQRSSFNDDAAKAGLVTPLDDTTLVKASESSYGVKEESFQQQSLTNAAERMEEASLSLVTEEMHQKALVEDTKIQALQTDSAKNEPATPIPSSNIAEKLHEQSLEEKIPSDMKRKAEESTPTPLLQENEANSNNNNETHAAKLKPLDNVAEKLDNQNLEEPSPINVKKTSKESKPPHSSRETNVNTIKNDIQLQQADASKRLEDSSSSDVGSLRSVIAEKIKSFSPKLAGEESDKQGPPEKTPRNIKKMISVFESSISQDRVPLKPMSTKSYRIGTSRSLKDHAVNNSEMSSSTRLRNSFSTGDLRKNLSSITTKGEQVGFKENVAEPSETNMQSKETIGTAGDELISDDPKGKEKLPKDSTAVASIGMINEEKIALLETNTKEIPESSEKGVSNEKKDAFTETYTKEIPESSEKGVKNEKDAFTETNTKEVPESSEKGVNNIKKVAFTETKTKEIPKSPEESVNNEERFALTETNTNEILKSCEEDATVSGRMQEDDKESNMKHGEILSNKVKDGIFHGKRTSKDNLENFYHDGSSGPWIFPDEKRHFCTTAQKVLQENTVASIPESIGQIEVQCESDSIVKEGEAMARISGNSSPKSSDEEDSTGSLGQAIKIALVVGFGVLVLLFRQREPREGKKKGNNRAVKNQVFMNKRGSYGEHRRKIGVFKLS